MPASSLNSFCLSTPNSEHRFRCSAPMFPNIFWKRQPRESDNSSQHVVRQHELSSLHDIFRTRTQNACCKGGSRNVEGCWDWHYKVALCVFLTLERGPICFSDTRRKPYVLYWHQEGALCAFMTPEKSPMCFSDTRKGSLLISEKQMGPPSGVREAHRAPFWCQ